MFNTGTSPFCATGNTFPGYTNGSIPSNFVPNFLQTFPSAFFGYANAPFAATNSPFAAQQAWNNAVAATLQNTLNGARPQNPTPLNNTFANTAFNPFNPISNSLFTTQAQTAPIATVINPFTGQINLVPGNAFGWNWNNTQNAFNPVATWLNPFQSSINPAFFASTTGFNPYTNSFGGSAFGAPTFGNGFNPSINAASIANSFAATPWGVVPTGLLNTINPANLWAAFNGFGPTPAFWANAVNSINPFTGQPATGATQNGQPTTGTPSLFREAA